MKHIKSQRGAALVLEVILIVAVLAIVGLAVYQGNSAKNKMASRPTPTPATSATPTPSNPYAGWKTYTSATEKASFKYPADWVKVASLESNDPKADSVGYQSPDGSAGIYWTSIVDGLGGMCDADAALGSSGACWLYTVVEKTAITGAPGLSVISGTSTKDGQIYKPWVAVLDSATETGRHMGYSVFKTKTSKGMHALFSTTNNSGLTGPSLNQTDATAWFKKPTVVQAKLALQSFSY
jgi:hypothetical protein